LTVDPTRFWHPFLWHDSGERILLLFLAALTLAGLPTCRVAEPNTALLRTLNPDPSESKKLEAITQLEKAGPLEAVQIKRSIADTLAVIRAAMVRRGAPLRAADP
jgi:hypothetical protein